MTTQFRAEHVGSLLRPQALLDARAAHAKGDVSDERLRELEDEAALAAIALQRDAGVEVFTEGEVRRGTFMAGLMESLGGLVPVEETGGLVSWHRAGMADPTPEELAFEGAAAGGKLYQKKAMTSTEAAFLAKHAPGQYKITMMAASMGTSLWQPGISDGVYPSPEQLLEDVVRLQIEEIHTLFDQGVSWIQLDSLSYMWIIDTELRDKFTAMTGLTAEQMLDMTVSMDRAVVEAAKAKNPDATIAMHFCRGNNRSAWMGEGSYEPVAERLFGEVGVDRFLLEYDSERAGGFEPLRHMPAGRTVMLGLVSTKTPQLESPDDLRRRIDAAAEYVPLENLGITTQCGFASTASGNLLTLDEQRRKLELVVQTAQKVWG
ncbi:cobalamin-independent methionine synthase II family protein [Dactylosporangium sp. McL0621]|uniref:cobalamin-independent methionine synthase II family protein n=1 Tax=Dactylosporangium sp. McL0621 TaxID=3415678 RepID=UPI003CF9C4AE